MTPPQPEPEPPTQGGQDRGNWSEGTEYVAGDTVTAYSQKYSTFKKYKARVAHTGKSENFPGRDTGPGVWETYWERID